MQRKYDTTILAIRSDNGSEFKNYTMDDFLCGEGIQHQYSAAYTPQQNGVAERKNRTLIEMARTMMAEFKSPYNFWAEAINTACHLSNRVFLRPMSGKTPYELLVGKNPLSLTFEFLVVDAKFTLKALDCLNLSLELLKAYLLVTPRSLTLIGSTTYPPGVLENL